MMTKQFFRHSKKKVVLTFNKNKLLSKFQSNTSNPNKTNSFTTTHDKSTSITTIPCRTNPTVPKTNSVLFSPKKSKKSQNLPLKKFNKSTNLQLSKMRLQSKTKYQTFSKILILISAAMIRKITSSKINHKEVSETSGRIKRKYSLLKNTKLILSTSIKIMEKTSLTSKPNPILITKI